MLTILLSNAQQGIQNPKEPTPQEIYNLLNMSAEFNGGLTIKDLDHPWMLQVGQTVTYQLQDGHKLQFVAEKGDNFWNLGKKALKYQTEHPENPIVKPDLVPQPTTEEEKVVPPVVDNNKSGGIPWWLWLIAAVLLLGFANAILEAQKAKRNKKEASKDPVTSGNPMRRNGVTDEQAPAYMQEVVARQFNTPGLNVTNITRGRLSGENLEVYYSGQLRPERRTFQDFPAYRGQVNINGEEQFVYFLQGCGNDVRMGNYFSGQNIRFIPEQVLQTAPQQPAIAQPVSSPVESHFLKMAKIADEAQKEGGNQVVFISRNGAVSLQINPEGLPASNGIAKELTSVAVSES